MLPDNLVGPDPNDDRAAKFSVPTGFPGQIIMWPTSKAPPGWLLCAANEYFYADQYPDLFNVLCPLLGDATFDPSTDIVTVAGHGLADDDIVQFVSDGALPGGLFTYSTTGSINISYQYYVEVIDDDTFYLHNSSNEGGLTPVNITSSGSANFVCHYSPHSIVVGSSGLAFFLPDFSGRYPIGPNNYVPNVFDIAVGEKKGSDTHSHNLSSNGYAAISANSSNEGFMQRIILATGYTATYKFAPTVSADGSTRANATPLGGQTDDDSSLPPSYGIQFIIKT